MDIKELENKIKENNQLYWSGNPQISDVEYDQLVEQLKAIDPNNPLINEINEQEVKSNGKVEHKNPMLSLDKVYNYEDLMDWVEKHSRNDEEVFIVQPKYDGISAHLENNILSTRGNGYVGENISSKLPIINIETVKDNYDELLGEIIIRKDDFSNKFSKIISPSTKKPYKNPRNATAGIMGTDDIKYFIDNNIKLTLIDYDKYSYYICCGSFFADFERIVERIEKLPYPMDGIVIKLADEEYGKSFGITAHHPKNAIALKFTNPQKETKLEDIEWSFGKNCLTPVAILTPIDINGITVERASLSNYDNIKSLDLKIGDNVIVERAGDVIPHIVSVIKNPNESERKNPFIEYCPCCKSKLKIESPEIMCINKDCFETNLRKLYYSIRSVGIDYVGLPKLRKIVTSLNIKNLYDFMQLTRTDLLGIGIGDKNSLIIAEEINKVKTINDYQFLTCLNINNVGTEVSKLILEKYSIEDLLKLNDAECLTSINGIGKQIANNIYQYIKENYDYIVNLRSLFFINKSVETMYGTVCFTGQMENPRKYYEDIASKNNLKPVNSVSKDLTLLVVADINSNSSKMQKAKKYGIDIITVEDFMQSYNA